VIEAIRKESDQDDDYGFAGKVQPRGRRKEGSDADPRGTHRVARRAKASAKASSSTAPAPKPSGAKASGAKASGAKASGAKSSGAKASGAKASGAKATGAKATAKKAAPKAPAPKMPAAPPPPPADSDDDFAPAPPPPPPAKVAPLFLGGPPKRAKRYPKKEGWAIGGGQVFFDKEYVAPVLGARAYSNWRFVCPHHPDCQRTLGFGVANTRNHGNLEPLAFLHAWRDVPPGPRGHRKTHPEQEAVTAFYHDHLAELQALAVACGAPH
jgi:hypothetical protein